MCDSRNFLINKREVLSLGSAMTTKLSMMPVGMGGAAEDAGLVKSDQQNKGVLGVKEGEMYTGCGLWWWF